MARISDIIAQFINDMIEDKKDKEVIIQRNELADKFNCAPSQINYVLTTRFTSEKGYMIESRRGGGGYIIIKRIEYNNKEKQVEAINKAIGESLTCSHGRRRTASACPRASGRRSMRWQRRRPSGYEFPCRTRTGWPRCRWRSWRRSACRPQAASDPRRW